MNKHSLRKINKGLVAMDIKPLSEDEYAKMIGAANACHDHPNRWNSYDRPWPRHHMVVGQIFMYVDEHPDGINAMFSLPFSADDSADVDITGCTTVEEAKWALAYGICKASSVDPRYAAALKRLIADKIKAMGSNVTPGAMQKLMAEILSPISDGLSIFEV